MSQEIVYIKAFKSDNKFFFDNENNMIISLREYNCQTPARCQTLRNQIREF